MAAKPSLAVLYFENLSGDESLNWLRTGLTDMLVTDLAQSPNIRVLGTDLKGRGAAFLGGLEWAVDNGIDVVNLSLSSKSEVLYADFHDVVDRAYFAGVTLVSAANNAPGASYPSLFSSVISVAAHEEPDPWRWYYNPRPPVEFGAWGVSVPIAWKDHGSTVATGNSFAAPHIAAFAALVRSKHPGLTPFEVKAALAATADVGVPPDMDEPLDATGPEGLATPD